MKYLYLILSFTYMFLLVLIPSTATAQLSQQWVKRYNGTGNYYDRPNKIFVDESGNVYVTGSSEGLGSAADFFTTKYSPSGIVLWESRYNGSGNSYDTPNGIGTDDSGNVYVTGGSTGVGTFGDFLTIKYNSSGVQKWVNRYNGPYNAGDGAYDILVDSEDNIYVTGEVFSSANNTDFCTIKYNSDGVRLWLATYDNGFQGEALGIGEDSLGNLYIAGNSGTGSSEDIVTIKYNSTGTRLWVVQYHVSGIHNSMVDFKVDPKGNSYITGYSRNTPYDTNTNCITLKYNSIGELQWAATYADPNNWGDNSNSVDVDQNGNVYIAGRTGRNYLAVKYNSEGTQQWFARYNGGTYSYDGATCIRVDHLGNTFVSGSCQRGFAMMDFITLKYSPTGGLLWEEGRYNGPSDSADYATYLALDENGSVLVTGASMGSGTSYDFATIKYSMPTSVIQLSSHLPESFSLDQNYPNPFNPSTKIRFEISKSSYIKLVVYDALGRVVALPVNENLKAGVYEAEFDGGELSSGVYSYRIQAGEFVETRKMLLLK